ncbi:MAG TPA: nuclear transport factor 2 family protein [Polyangiaceae bacterium]|jgi:ketosteroid isomerase-like protein
MSNDALIERFYGALAKGDGEGAAACYGPDARFSDPVFQDLRGKEPGEMWRMLARRAKDMRIELREHSAEGDTGSAHWVARYTFSQTGRPVVNDIHATFRFAGGLIADHRDRFDLHRWARQALGPVGLLLGWTPIVQGSIRRKARAGLDAFMARSG